MKPVLNKTEMVEVDILNATSQSIFFPEVNNLENKIITRIDARPFADYSGDVYGVTGKTHASTSLLQKVFLTLKRKGKEIYNKIPLYYFYQDLNFGNRLPLLNYLDLEQCFIYVPDPSVLTANEIINFTFWYQDRDEEVQRFARRYQKNKLLRVNHELEEVVLTSTIDQKFYFPDDERLHLKNLLGIYCESPQYYSYTASGKTKVSNAIWFNSFLTLVDYNNREVVKNMPLSHLRNGNQYKNNSVIFNGLKINWPKSYIQVASGLTPTLDTAIPFSIFYK